MQPTHTIAELVDLPDGSHVAIKGSVAAFQLKRNKAGDLWAAVTLTERGAEVTALIFTRAFAAMEFVPEHCDQVVVHGRLTGANAQGVLRITAETVAAAD